jgi:long-chain acyl-CoA synthetase
VLIDLLRRSAAREGQNPAVVVGATPISYGELLHLSAKLARGLSSAGIEPGDRVVILLRNSPEFIVSFFATTGIGAAAVLLDPHARTYELAHAREDCRPRAIITDPAGLARWREASDEAASDLSLVVDWDRPNGLWNALNAHEPLTEWETDDDRIATYQYSSGSTGRAKRIGRSHAQLSFEARSIAAALGHSAEDVVLCAVPLFHSYGCGSCLLTAFEAGATLLLQEHVQPFKLHRGETLALARTWGATVFPAVPYMIEALADVPDPQGFATLRYCGSSGVPLAEAAFKAFDARFGVPVRQDYGSTEAGKIAANVDPDPRPSWASVGRAVPGVELVILDDRGSPVIGPDVGRVAIRSPGLCTDHPVEERGNPAFLGEYFLTGDLGFLDAAGRLSIVGRTKLYLEVLGEKVDPSEVEEVLALHPNVRETAVVCAEGRAGETVLKAVVVPSSSCLERDLIRFCRERLSSFKVPAIIEFRDSLPRSAVGKILRKDLLDTYE